MSLIADSIDRYIQAEREDRKGEQTYWYPSVIGGCKRQAVLRRAGHAGKSFDPRTLRVFWMGDRVHEGLTAAVAGGLPEGWKVIGVDPWVRVRDEEFGVSGRPDMLVQNDKGEFEIFEFKSVKTESFQYQDFPKKDHVIQTILMGTFRPAIRQEFPDGTEILSYYNQLPVRGRIYYHSKQDAEGKECVVEFTDESRQQVKDRLQELTQLLLEYQATGQLPPALPEIPVLEEGEQAYYVRGPKKGLPKTKLDWRVGYCPFKDSGKCCGDKTN